MTLPDLKSMPENTSGEREKANTLLPYTVKLANNHQASICSMMGEHTSGHNSDSFYVNEDVEKSYNFPELLVLVADGVSGNQESQKLLAGKFAANYFTKHIPENWNELSNKGGIKFKQSKFKEEKEANNLHYIYNWLMHQIDVDNSHDLYYWLEAFSMGRNLLINPLLENFEVRGKTASEVADEILIEKSVRMALTNLLYSLSRTIVSFTKEMTENFMHLVDVEDNFQSLTTLTGILEVKESYLLFGIGDSRSYLVKNGDGLKIDTATRKHSIGNCLTSCVGGIIREFTPEAVLPSIGGFSVKVIEKKSIDEKDQLVCQTDGFGAEELDLLMRAETIAHQNGETHLALKKVLEGVLEKEAIYKKSLGKRYLPDDKTMIVLRKET